MAKRDLSDQYAGQVLGTLWSVIYPVVFIGIYIFIFSLVFHQRVGGTHAMPLGYTAYILAGLVPWLGFQVALSKTASALISESSLVKQVVFPIEVLPIKMVLSSFYGQIVSFSILIIYDLLSHGSLMLSFFLLPYLLVMQFLATLGVGYILAAVTPFIRDIKDIITIYCIVGIYLIPVVYLPSWIPKLFKPLIYLNPISYMIWCYQDALYFGRFAHPKAWIIFSIGSVIIYFIGYKTFQKLKPYIGNVL